MTPIETYRTNAAAERAAATKTSLSNRKAMHERSALVWEEMAQAAEEHVIKAAVNAASKNEWRSGKPGPKPTDEHKAEATTECAGSAFTPELSVLAV